ncbi:hypothetical protein ARMGADRAFT_1036157 [Armillaria gallica]|uniref:Uncharacterized protein n=1 Tax=Armillaria gallica TaxID=47427 RepID=A0A2H3D4K1_ARMGA|nr:hypothetical protein ARMGADRAFT_1036157 [Armillaria gallica]
MKEQKMFIHPCTVQDVMDRRESNEINFSEELPNKKLTRLGNEKTSSQLVLALSVLTRQSLHNKQSLSSTTAAFRSTARNLMPADNEYSLLEPPTAKRRIKDGSTPHQTTTARKGVAGRQPGTPGWPEDEDQAKVSCTVGSGVAVSIIAGKDMAAHGKTTDRESLSTVPSLDKDDYPISQGVELRVRTRRGTSHWWRRRWRGVSELVTGIEGCVSADVYYGIRGWAAQNVEGNSDVGFRPRLKNESSGLVERDAVVGEGNTVRYRPREGLRGVLDFNSCNDYEKRDAYAEGRDVDGSELSLACKDGRLLSRGVVDGCGCEGGRAAIYRDGGGRIGTGDFLHGGGSTGAWREFIEIG